MAHGALTLQKQEQTPGGYLGVHRIHKYGSQQKKPKTSFWYITTVLKMSSSLSVLK
jgi:hypothetical protein